MIAMLVIETIAVPLLLSVIVLAALVVPTFWLPNGRLLGERPITVPAPIRGTFWGLLIALSVKTTAAVLLPMAVGLKITATVQLDPAAKLLPQELVEMRKSALFVPVTLMLVIVKRTLPRLVTFTFLGALPTPTN